MDRTIKFGLLGSFLLFSAALWLNAFAATPAELKAQIEERNSEIAKLETEIRGYQTSLEAAAQEASTLKNEIKKFDLRIKNLSTEISLTQKQINKKELEIEALGFDIIGTESDLTDRRKLLKEILRELNEKENESVVEVMLKYGTLSRFFDALESIKALDTGLRQNYEELNDFKAVLKGQKTEAETAQEKLINLRVELGDRKKLEEIERVEQDRLLKATKNREAEYQKLLAEKRAQKEDFEREQREIESQLQYILDAAKIPAAGLGILLWPLEESSAESCYTSKNPLPNCVTQYFGETEFSKTAAYSGKGHNGVDFRAAVGTKVRTALSGVVKEINNVSVRGCQYGKWILIEHKNGLSTLYAHLSLIKSNLAAGQTVSTGDLIGYSGDTGYAVGPHLHFTVYVAEAVAFSPFTCKSGSTVNIPVAAYSAYLNPLDYL